MFSTKVVHVFRKTRTRFYRIIRQKTILYLQPIITQYFIGNKSEIWSLSLIVHSKG